MLLDAHLHLGAGTEPADLLLRHREVHVQRVERLQRHDGRAAGEVLAEVHLPDAENSREGSPDHLPLDRGPDLADARLGLLVLGAHPVELGLRDDALRDEAPHALQVHGRQLALGLGRGKLRPLLSRVEADEDLALTDRLARLEQDRLDDTGQVRAHGHAADGLDRADGLERSRPRLEPSPGRWSPPRAASGRRTPRRSPTGSAAS